ncbi:MAG: hypothetical protein II453_07070 [Alphaproteobacteria bacterium]|nr:hypothetical protein [Alphaproteobacteria bacterium]
MDHLFLFELGFWVGIGFMMGATLVWCGYTIIKTLGIMTGQFVKGCFLGLIEVSKK